MNIWEVAVTHSWEGTTTFEFDSEEEADKFKDAVDDGNLDAVIDAGDIYSNDADTLVDYSASFPAERVLR